MGVLFSAVTVTAGDKQSEFLVAGIPTEYGDLEGWTLFEEFMDELDEECTVKVHADAYVYGEGEEFIATPEEVAYMTIRRQDRPDFLESRCHERGESEFDIDWSPKELFNMEVRNPTRSNGNNLLHLVNKYMDLYIEVSMPCTLQDVYEKDINGDLQPTKKYYYYHDLSLGNYIKSEELNKFNSIFASLSI